MLVLVENQEPDEQRYEAPHDARQPDFDIGNLLVDAAIAGECDVGVHRVREHDFLHQRRYGIHHADRPEDRRRICPCRDEDAP